MRGKDTALVVQHMPDDPAGLVGEWLEASGVRQEVVAGGGGAGPAGGYPDPERFGLVVVLGSPEAAYDDRVPWLGAELAMVRQALRARTPVLGICFGGQLLARALGGRVERAPAVELGWRPVGTRRADAVPDGPWLEWHNDRFEVPPGATELARNDAGPQAFALGPHLGVQFHPEVTPEMLVRWRPLVAAAGQDPTLLPDLDPQGWSATRRAVGTLLDAWRASWPR